MRLNDPLVTTFLYNNEKYKIDLSFDNVLDVFDVIGDETLRDYEKAEINLALLLGDQSFEKSNTIDLWNHIYESFIHIESKQPIEYDRKGNPMPVRDEDTKNFIDLEKDAEYIFASFQQAYQIDLYEYQGKMHWLKFKALLNGLPGNTIMQRIIQIRMWKPSEGDSAEYKQSMEKLQRIYELDDEGPEEVD